jgi:hypothetical protein
MPSLIAAPSGELQIGHAITEIRSRGTARRDR